MKFVKLFIVASFLCFFNFAKADNPYILYQKDEIQVLADTVKLCVIIRDTQTGFNYDAAVACLSENTNDKCTEFLYIPYIIVISCSERCMYITFMIL